MKIFLHCYFKIISPKDHLLSWRSTFIVYIFQHNQLQISSNFILLQDLPWLFTSFDMIIQFHLSRRSTFMAYIFPVSAFRQPYTSPKPPRPMILQKLGGNYFRSFLTPIYWDFLKSHFWSFEWSDHFTCALRSRSYWVGCSVLGSSIGKTYESIHDFHVKIFYTFVHRKKH